MLALSRAVGDKQFKNNTALKPEEQKVSIVPEVKTINLDDDVRLMVMACDGIWDVKSNQEVIDYFHKAISGPDEHNYMRSSSPSRKKPEGLEDIVGNFLHSICPEKHEPPLHLGTDNMSCIVIQFKS